MDDLLGEDWQSNGKPKTSITSNGAFASAYSSLRPSPQVLTPAVNTPLNLSRPSSTVTGGPARSTTSTPKPAADAFGGLTGLKSKAAGANVSIQERQRQLAEERQRQLQAQGQLWDNLGASKVQKQPATLDDEDDILAAFNKDAKVDNASHFPPPAASNSGRGTPSGLPGSQQQVHSFDADDDTFGLMSLPHKRNGTVKTSLHENDNDDILGALNKPVTRSQPDVTQDSSDSDGGWDENVANGRSGSASQMASDGPLAELVDMGFPLESARTALERNDGDTQRAVGWLLQQAHEESKQKMREQQDLKTGRRSSPTRSDQRNRSRARNETAASSTRNTGEKDASQMAQEFGNKLFKSANSLWKASQKQMAKTISDFQQERDPSQPKWMQNADNSRDSSQRPAERRVQRETASASVTNEAALLDMPRTSLPARPAKSTRQPQARESSPAQFRDEEVLQKPGISMTAQAPRPVAKLTRQAVEEQSEQAYISPARRRKAAPQAKPEPEVDLFSPEPAPSRKPALAVAQSRPTPVPSPRPSVPARSIPSVSPVALSTSAGHRKRGTEAFKRGDYTVAHEAYTAALTPLPPVHPIVIVVLSNRSLTALKTGDAKVAVSDADRSLEIIGPGLGVGETIDVEGEAKDMREFYGKALMRKAEALEHLEKWADAGAVWRIAVEAGVGGAVSIRGKERCERALAPKPAPKAAARPAPRAKPAPKAVTSSVASADAVRKLREANAAADRVDDEKFQLTDQVDARLAAWKGGKADNLRALLQSLDTVLWSNAGWKKVGMSDLVMPNKVKIIYMKAIAKVHPDKIAQSASTEERMISASVFSTLNEAWDKFKKDNNL